MTQVIYQGPHPEVVVDELSQTQVITAGQPVEIPDDLAARLLEQSTWELYETSEQIAAREQQERDEQQAALDAQAQAAAQAQAGPDGVTVETSTEGSN